MNDIIIGIIITGITIIMAIYYCIGITIIISSITIIIDIIIGIIITIYYY